MKKIAFAAMLCASASFSPVHAQSKSEAFNNPATVTSVRAVPTVLVEINGLVNTTKTRMTVSQVFLNNVAVIGVGTDGSVDPNLSTKLQGATCRYSNTSYHLPDIGTARCTK